MESDPHSLNERGNALSRERRYDEALACFDQAIALRGDFAEAHSNRGTALLELSQPEAAAHSLLQALKLQPGRPEVHSNLGNALMALRQWAMALDCYDRALALKPDYANAHFNRGNALIELGQPQAAVEAFARALALRPDFDQAHGNLGNAYQRLNRLPEALASYERALALAPNDAEHRWNRALSLLASGDLAAGWPLYEARWDNPKTGLHVRHRDHPLWQGQQPLTGQTVLLHAEQGLGDTLQFCRYARQVAALGARVVLEAPATLLGLLASLDGVDQLLPMDAALPSIDWQCPLLSLPLAFGTTLDSIPAAPAYLKAEPERMAKWRERLGPRRQPRIGLIWSGRAAHGNDANRSLALEQLAPYLPSGAQYVSLQQQVREADLPTLEHLQAQHGLLHFDAALGDFSDTAALCAQMDLVLSVDTSVAHLAGALGRPLWLLLPFSPDWRWLLTRRDSPWYPSATLWRQSAIGDWSALLAQLRAGLAAWIAVNPW